MLLNVFRDPPMLLLRVCWVGESSPVPPFNGCIMGVSLRYERGRWVFVNRSLTASDDAMKATRVLLGRTT